VAGGAIGLIPLDGRIGLAVLAGFLALALARAVQLTGRLRRERLTGAPPPEEETTIDLGSTSQPAAPEQPRTTSKPKRWGTHVGASWSRKKPAAPTERAPSGPAPAPRGGERAPAPAAEAEPATERKPAERPTRTLTEPESPPGFHLYRPTRPDRTLDLDDDE
jgi:hypothetical protein